MNYAQVMLNFYSFQVNLSQRDQYIVAPVGKIYSSLFQFVALPIYFSSLILSVSSTQSNNNSGPDKQQPPEDTGMIDEGIPSLSFSNNLHANIIFFISE